MARLLWKIQFWAILPAVLAVGVASVAVQAEGPASPKTDAVKWPAQLREWRKWMTVDLADPEKTVEAGREKIEAIDDPAAVPAIVSLLKSEKNPHVRRALVKPLLALGGKEAVAALVKWSVEDDNPLLREEIASGLAGNEELPPLLDKYIDYLRQPRWATNAAQALRWTKLAVRQSSSDPVDPKLAGALIDALVQKQKKRVPYWVAVDTGWIPHTSKFSGGSGNYRHQEYKESYVDVVVPMPNPEVHKTLTTYASQNFDYDQSAWRKALTLKEKR